MAQGALLYEQLCIRLSSVHVYTMYSLISMSVVVGCVSLYCITRETVSEGGMSLYGGMLLYKT